MAKRELEPTPDQKPAPRNDLVVILKNLPQGKSVPPGRVSKDLYDLLVQDRPGKFNESQVNFRKKSDVEQKCEGCIHFYKGKQRTVCEILRKSDDSSIEDGGICDFWSADGTDHPLLDSDS